MKWQYGILAILAVTILGGCATMPTGPTVMVMPGAGKPFEVFVADDNMCRLWAERQIGGASPSQTANQNLATGAVVGTLLGAGVGAAIGSATGNAGPGAAIGAGAGLLTGTAAAGPPAYASQYALQRQYDIAYMQCMYSKGNQVPGVRRRTAYAPPPPPPRASAGSWVTVPGQYVNGKWVPEHKVQVSPGQAPETAPPPQAPPGGTYAPVRPQ